MRKFLVMLLCVWPWLAVANPVLPDLSEMPVLHEGRVKPLDTVARIYLRDIYGADHLQGEPAHLWLTRLMFEPAQGLDEPVIRIASPAIRSMLQLEERTPPLYSYHEIRQPLQEQKTLLAQLGQKDRNTLTASELALWNAYLAVDRMTQFSGTLSLFLPLQEGPFLDQFPQLNAWREQLKAVVAAKGENVAAYTDDEQKLALKVFRLDTLEAMGNENRLLRLIPLSWSDEWMSPWQLVLSGRTSPQTGKLLEGWQALVNAAQQGDAAQVEAQTQALQLAGDAVAKVSPMKMQLEMWSNQLDLLPKAAALYALLTLAGIAAYVLAKPHWHRIIMWLMLLPLLLHSVVIAQRIMILGRPPVGTLYESVLFVGLMAALWGWWLARRKQLPEAMLCGGALGGLLLAVSGNYAGQGDSMGMLIAVLNTQFWLATHVVCITIGYATALIAGTLGHVVLWKPESKVASVLPAATVIALLFTATGTVLGGIWADQSWGRFWGWDPKENGALLIVLWLVWLLHGRMTAHIGGTGFAALLALTNVVVAISWFGVNLLNVGLHSYGFTNAAATGLYSFCAAEALIIGALYLRARKGVAA